MEKCKKYNIYKNVNICLWHMQEQENQKQEQ